MKERIECDGKRERMNNERRGTKEGTRAGMSRLLVSQTRGRYLQADQWQSTERPEIFVGSSVAEVN